MPTQIEAGTAAVGVFCFEDNDGMIQCQCKLNFPTAELTFWWPEISWKPVWLSRGGASLEEKNCFLNTFTQRIVSRKTIGCFQSVVFVDIPYVIGCRDVCDS